MVQKKNKTKIEFNIIFNVQIKPPFKTPNQFYVIFFWDIVTLPKTGKKEIYDHFDANSIGV